MVIKMEIPLLEAIFEEWKPVIGDEFPGYRNHVYRMVHVCWALGATSEEDQKKVMIAAAFHDIGIWIKDTVDYIGPSIPPAMAYLDREGLEAWKEEISLMISEHHKITEYKDPKYPLVEIFRKVDLVDFSLGVVTFGLSKTYLNELKGLFPNEDFHKNLAKRAAKWFIKHPFNPVPMMKL